MFNATNNIYRVGTCGGRIACEERETAGLTMCSEVPIPVDMYACSRNYTLVVLEWIAIRNDSQSKMLSIHHVLSRFPQCSSGRISVLSVQAWICFFFSETVISFNLIHGGSQVPGRKG